MMFLVFTFNLGGSRNANYFAIVLLYLNKTKFNRTRILTDRSAMSDRSGSQPTIIYIKEVVDPDGPMLRKRIKLQGWGCDPP